LLKKRATAILVSESTPFIALAFQNGVEYRNSGFKMFICDDLGTLCKNLVNFGLVTLEFKRMKCVHFLVHQQFSYVCLAAPLLDAVAISTEFCVAISTQICFTHSLGGLHARLYDAFLVLFY